MKHSVAVLVLCCLRWILFAASTQAVPLDITFPDDSVDPLATLKTPHPRLIASAEQFDALAKATDDPLRMEVIKRVIALAETMLKAPMVQYDLEKGRTPLYQSRSEFQHIVLCAMAYRLTHDLRFAERAKQEMVIVAGFPDWYPDQFLNTAEMAMAVGIGYDWCYDALSPEERKTIKQGLMKNALVFAPLAYGKRLTDSEQFDKKVHWVCVDYNWNVVCNGGMLAAALAVADEEPAEARQVIQGVRAYLPIALHCYAPDGAWKEGPDYLSYATSYTALALSMLESSLGTDFGLSKVEPAFSKAAMFHQQLVSPSGFSFNYGDAHANDEIHGGIRPCFGWLAARYGPPIVAAQFRQSLQQEFARLPVEQKDNQYFALHALWLPPEPKGGEAGAAALDAHFRGDADLAIFRSAWGDPDALYLGFKNGRNGVAHSHLDLGSFLLDADQVRWSAQLGEDLYALPNYFANRNYFRRNNYSKSTIIPGHLLQDTKAVAPIFSFQSTPDQASAVADLSAAYPGAARKIIRGVFFQYRARVLVQDDITGLAPDMPLNWQMITQGKIDISEDGHTAILTRDNKTLRVELLSPANAQFQIGPATPPTPAENPNKGYSILLGTVPAEPKPADVRLAVLLTPVGPKWPANLPAPQLETLPGTTESFPVLP